MNLSEPDRAATVNRYRSQYAKYGYSPKSLGWDKGKQDIRFEVLAGFFDCMGKSILDIGCGFGDLNRVLERSCGEDYTYLGIDLVEEFVQEGRRRYRGQHIQFEVGDFMDLRFERDFDIVLSSGIFNHKFEETDNYRFIMDVLEKSMRLVREGVAFDFLSDKVDFRHAHTFHSSPEKIISMGYQLSRNVVLRNDYFPFEFSLCLKKDDGFLPEDTIFLEWKKRANYRGD